MLEWYVGGSWRYACVCNGGVPFGFAMLRWRKKNKTHNIDPQQHKHTTMWACLFSEGGGGGTLFSAP